MIQVCHINGLESLFRAFSLWGSGVHVAVCMGVCSPHFTPMHGCMVACTSDKVKPLNTQRPQVRTMMITCGCWPQLLLALNLFVLPMMGLLLRASEPYTLKSAPPRCWRVSQRAHRAARQGHLHRGGAAAEGGCDWSGKGRHGSG